MKWRFPDAPCAMICAMHRRGSRRWSLLLVLLVAPAGLVACTGDPTIGGIFWDEQKSRQRIAILEHTLEAERMQADVTTERQSQLEAKRAEAEAELKQLRHERLRSEAAIQHLREEHAKLDRRLAEVEKQAETAIGEEGRQLEIERDQLKEDIQAIRELLWES